MGSGPLSGDSKRDQGNAGKKDALRIGFQNAADMGRHTSSCQQQAVRGRVSGMAAKLAKITEKTNGVLLAMIVVLLFLQVVTRYFNSSSFLWVGEAALWIFVWMVFLGAAVLFHKKEHMIVDIIEYFLSGKTKEKIQRRLAKIIRMTCWVFLIIVFYYSIIFTVSVANQYAVSFRLSRVYLSAALPVSIVIMLIFEILSLYEKKGGNKQC
jgi:TRAP-type transport system small permease protein